MARRLSHFVVLLLLVIAQMTHAQEFASGGNKDAKPASAAEKKAFDLLEVIADQIPNLHAPSNRIRAESVVADMLWTRDEKTARSLFKTLSGEMVALIADVDFSDQQAYQQISFINQQRQEIIQRISHHDPELALTFLHETRLPPSAIDPRANWYVTNETNMEFQIAALIAARDPARTLALARASLSKGVTYGLIGLLNQLQQKDSRSAQTLHAEMVEQIKSEDLVRNQEFANAAWSLISFQPPKAKEESYRDLISTLADAALTIAPTDQNRINFAQNLNNQIQSQMPQIEKYAPERVNSLRQWSQNIERSLDPSARMYKEMNELSQRGSVDDMLAFAEKYPPELRNQIYQSASWKAFSSGDPNRGRQIVSDFIADPVQRRAMLEQYDTQGLSKATDENKTLEARRLLSRAKTLDRKIQILTQLANNLESKGDKKGALSLLSEARGLADSSPPSSMQMSVQMQLAQAYVRLDPDQSFAIIQPLISKTNELIAAAAVLDGFENRFLKEGEWLTPGAGNTGGIVSSLNQGLANLARIDFDRARSLADQFDRPEVRLMAQLAIAQGALNLNNVGRLDGRRFVSLNGGGNSFIID